MEIQKRIQEIKSELEIQRLNDIEESMINNFDYYSPDFWDFERIMEENGIEGRNMKSPIFQGFPESSI